MKGYAFASVLGTCAYDFEHPIKVGDKVLRIQGPGWTRAKDYCWTCGERLHGANDALPEFSYGSVSSSPVRPLMSLSERFDPRMAAAKGEE